MKSSWLRVVIAVSLLCFVFVGFVGKIEKSPTASEIPIQTAIGTAGVATAKLNTPIKELAPTETQTPTATLTPTTIPLSERESVLLLHELERVEYIEEQGVAQSIPVFELHGDNYYMVFGSAVVELSPEAFENQMKWFRENRVHAVTGDELISWLKGDIDLPTRSVILTFDLGTGHSESRYRVVDVFRKYQMFGIFTILVQNMDQTDFCPNDSCWQSFRDAYSSGYVTIGSHTMTHRDFATLSDTEGLRELAESKKVIEEKIGQGCVVNTLTWPFESVPSWAPLIKDIGFEVAFAGSTYHQSVNTIWLDKSEDYYKLPRVFPPNSDGYSRRPDNKTLSEMMEMYWNIKD